MTRRWPTRPATSSCSRAVMIAVVLVTRAPDWRPRVRARSRRRLALAAAVVGVCHPAVVAPVPRARRASSTWCARSRTSIRDYSATPTGYLAARRHASTISTWSAALLPRSGRQLLPRLRRRSRSPASHRRRCARRVGRSTAARARVVDARRDRRRRVSCCRSARATPVYGWLYRRLSADAGAFARRRASATCSCSAIVGPRRARAGGAAGAAALRIAADAATGAIALVALVNVESLRAPFEYRRFDGIPRRLRLLADRAGPVVLAEVPFYPARRRSSRTPSTC